VATRVVDVFVNEGHKALHRIAFGAFRRLSELLLQLDEEREMQLALYAYFQSLERADELMRDAYGSTYSSFGSFYTPWNKFGSNLKKEEEEANVELLRQAQGSFRRRSSVDALASSLYYLPKVVPPSAIADEDQLDTAWFWLPAHLRIRDAVCVYSSASDGLRLATLLERCVEHAVEENLLLIKTMTVGTP
jgi:hypothetical protein